MPSQKVVVESHGRGHTRIDLPKMRRVADIREDKGDMALRGWYSVGKTRHITVRDLIPVRPPNRTVKLGIKRGEIIQPALLVEPFSQEESGEGDVDENAFVQSLAEDATNEAIPCQAVCWSYVQLQQGPEALT